MPTPEEIIWHQTTELLQRDSELAALRQQQTRILSWYDVSQELAQAIREDSTVEAVLESWADAMVSRMGFHVALVLRIEGTLLRRVCRRPSLDAESAEPVDESCAALLKRSPSGRVENGSTEVPVLARLGRIERFFYGQIAAGRSHSYLLAVGYDARGVRLRAALHNQDLEPFYRAALQVESLAKNVLLVQSLAHQEELKRLSAELSEQKEALQQQLGLILSQGALIRRLSAPVLQVWDGVLVLPIIGELSADRGEQVTMELLERISTTRSRCVLIDVTGLETMDSSAASWLLRMCRASALLGVTLILTGLRTSAAQTLVNLGVDLKGLQVYRNLHAGLLAALQTVEPTRKRHLG